MFGESPEVRLMKLHRRLAAAEVGQSVWDMDQSIDWLIEEFVPEVRQAEVRAEVQKRSVRRAEEEDDDSEDSGEIHIGTAMTTVTEAQEEDYGEDVDEKYETDRQMKDFCAIVKRK